MEQAGSKGKRSSTSLPIGEGQRRVRCRRASPRAKPTLSALLMAASSNMKRNYYHVFLSFRGPDVRHGFLSHLYAALDKRGIHTFVDREELRKGEEISPTLVRAIEESRIAIIVFSENYASSPWCLDELLKIMECKEQNDLMVVFPVFYKVEPREVREGRESYKRAMDNHESKFGKDSEKVKRWKKALLDAGNLSGWDFNDRDDEAELIQSIVNELSICLRPRSLYVAKYPVGIESQVQKLISLSEPAGSDVLMIGLWGHGGIGKTTIAKALYNAIENQFQDCSFLEQVREKSNQSNGRVALQKQLLSEILLHTDIPVYNVDGGISLIRERLCRKKVLLVLDDVDHRNQLDVLAGKGNWFGKGSRIVVTTRNKQLLTSHGINCVYKVQTLEHREARELFCQHAFPDGKSDEIGKDLINRAVNYCDGLPLALEVLGSFFCRRNEDAWESELQKLSKIPDPDINQVLRTSFDGLGNNEREIFLDIACFFKEKSMMYIKEVLDSCDFSTTIGIEILIERSLIKNERGILQMHDLVQLMGKDIVNQECSNDPRKRSRFWLFEDFQDILCENTEMNAVKVIILDLPTAELITINSDTFSNMKMLRVLILYNVHISSKGPIRLPNELRYLLWPNATDLEFGAGPKKLERLYVQKSHITQLRGNIQNFRKLKSINFSKCESLASVPDLSSALNLESLSLDWCTNLVEVHQFVGCLENLKLLDLEGCSNLSIFPNRLKTKSLQGLWLSGCSKLEKFPDILAKMGHLKCLKLHGTAIKELPASIENLVSVNEIELALCKNLARLPLSIYKLKNLHTMIVENCSNLVMFPKNIKDSTDPDDDLGFQNLYCLVLSGCNLQEVEFLESSSSFPNLGFLNLSDNRFTHLPTCINNYNNLSYLLVRKCKQLQEIPELPPNLFYLEANDCKSLQKLPDLSGHSFKKLTVDLSSCSELLRKGVNFANVSLLEELRKMEQVDIIQSGREMPEWILLCEEGSTSFMIPQDLYDKSLGLALCVVVDLEDGKKVVPPCEVQILVNCQEVFQNTKYLQTSESDVMWLCYVARSDRIKVNEHLRNDRGHVQVGAKTSKGRIKKYGFRLICEQQEDDLRVVFPAPSADKKKLEFLGEDSEEDNRDRGRRQSQVKQMKRKAHHL